MEGEPTALFGSSSRDDILAALRALALARGAAATEFDAALAEDRLDILIVDYLLAPGEEARTGEEMSQSSGIPLDEADRLWRALGFPEAGGKAVFTEQDIDALRTLRGLVDLGLSSRESSVQVTRVLGQSMSRLADAVVGAADSAAEEKGLPSWATRPEDSGILLAEALAFSSELVFPNIEKLIIYAWRRHIQAGARRRASMRRSGVYASSSLPQLTVGFADMVGFTALSSQLSAEALARVVDRFEELAHTIVVDGGGRPVKMIGDEVMFVTDDAIKAVQIGLGLADAYADDELLSDVRVGIGTGPVLMREGDFFGSVVNRAHRIVSIADAGTVLCSDEVRAEILAVGDFEPADLVWQALKPRELKDIGRVALWQVRRAGAGPSEHRRSGARWRRLSEMSTELAALRERGERALGAIVAPQPGRGSKSSGVPGT
ncbi:MAG: adenylate/guanylate cyclase domain-containing protein [Acidimicrobiales bacterium]